VPASNRGEVSIHQRVQRIAELLEQASDCVHRQHKAHLAKSPPFAQESRAEPLLRQPPGGLSPLQTDSSDSDDDASPGPSSAAIPELLRTAATAAVPAIGVAMAAIVDIDADIDIEIADIAALAADITARRESPAGNDVDDTA